MTSGFGCDPSQMRKLIMMRAVTGMLVAIMLCGIPVWLRVYAAHSGATAVAAIVQSASPGSIASGIFTAEQAKRGEQLYQSRCAECHGDKLVSDSDAPTLTAPAFKYSWHQKTIAERLERIRTTMPPGGAGSLSDQEYLDIIAYILEFNGYPVGNQELKPDKGALEKIVIKQAPGGD